MSLNVIPAPPYPLVCPHCGFHARHTDLLSTHITFGCQVLQARREGPRAWPAPGAEGAVPAVETGTTSPAGTPRPQLLPICAGDVQPGDVLDGYGEVLSVDYPHGWHVVIRTAERRLTVLPSCELVEVRGG